MQPSSPQRDAAAYMTYQYTEPKSPEGLINSFATLRNEQLAMQSRISQLAEEISSVRSHQEQAVDGLGGLIEQVSKSVAVAVQRSEERLQGGMQGELSDLRAEFGRMRVEVSQTVTVECRKAVREQLNSALSTCASLVEAMQLKLKQLETSKLDRRLAQLEVMLLGCSQEQKDMGGSMTRPASWAAGLEHSSNSTMSTAPGGENASCGPSSDPSSTASSVSGKPFSTASSLYSHANTILESLSPQEKEKAIAQGTQMPTNFSLSLPVGTRRVSGSKDSPSSVHDSLITNQHEMLRNSQRRDQSVPPLRPEGSQNTHNHLSQYEGSQNTHNHLSQYGPQSSR